VVIAIIGILSSVVLANLTNARLKANNGAVKSQLNSMRAEAEIIAQGSTTDYSTVCSAPSSKKLYDAAVASGEAGGGACYDVTGAYAASVKLKLAEGSITHWCIDSSGNSKGETAGLATDATLCS